MTALNYFHQAPNFCPNHISCQSQAEGFQPSTNLKLWMKSRLASIRPLLADTTDVTAPSHGPSWKHFCFLGTLQSVCSMFVSTTRTDSIRQTETIWDFSHSRVEKLSRGAEAEALCNPALTTRLGCPGGETSCHAGPRTMFAFERHQPTGPDSPYDR